MTEQTVTHFDGTREYRIVGINPEPWAIGPLGTMSRGGKKVPFIGANEVLTNYQAALRTAINELNPVMMEGPSELEMFFWRKLDKYSFGDSTKHQRHIADATNLAKGTEDALQGILFANDRLNLVVYSHVVEQSTITHPGIIIMHRAHDGYWPGAEYVEPRWQQLREQGDSVPDLGNLI